MMISRRIQPYVAASQGSSAVHVRRYDAEGTLKEVVHRVDRAVLPPIIPKPLLQGRMSTRDHEINAVRHSQKRRERRRAESTSPTREGGAFGPQQQPQQPPVANSKLSSGFRTDSKASKRRTEVQDARNAMTWNARRRVAGGLSADGGGSWQPAVSANYHHAGDLHSADLAWPDPKTALNQTSPKKAPFQTSPKRKKAGKKRRRKLREAGAQAKQANEAKQASGSTSAA